MAASTKAVHATCLISVMFTPGFQVDGVLPDVVLVSLDSVAFYVHRNHLLAASTNAFSGLLAKRGANSHTVPETATVLNVVLHTIYGMSCIHFQPPLESVEAALGSLLKYGVPPSGVAASQTIHQLLLASAASRPIEAYAVAAHYKLEKAAVALSAHLTTYDLKRLSDTLKAKMGPSYLKRLADMQHARLDALCTIVRRPPAQHPPTDGCNDEAQRGLGDAWALASAELVRNPPPSTSTGVPQSTFAQAAARVACPDCQTMLRNRIQEVVNEWSEVKPGTI